MGGEDPGITITLREIYDLVQGVATGVRELNERVGKLEDKGKEACETDERSRRALQIAEEAKEAVDKLEQYKSALEKAIVMALISGAIGLLFYFAQK